MSDGLDQVDGLIGSWRKSSQPKHIRVLVDNSRAYFTQKYLLSALKDKDCIAEVTVIHSVHDIIRYMSSGKYVIIVMTQDLLEFRCSPHVLRQFEDLLFNRAYKKLIVYFEMPMTKFPKGPLLFRQLDSVHIDINVLENSVDVMKRNLDTTNQLHFIHDTAEAWALSYYFNHLQVVLQGLPELITESTLFHENVGTVSMTFFIIIPKNNEAKDLQSLDPTIHQVQSFTLEKIRGGSRKRFVIPVYQIRKPHGKSYYMCGEIPAFYDLLISVQEETLIFESMEEGLITLKKFYYKLEEILNHQLNPECCERTKIIFYTEASINLSDLLWAELEDELAKHNLSQLSQEKSTRGTNPLLENQNGGAEPVCLVYEKESKKRVAYVTKILSANGYDTCSVMVPTSEIVKCRESIRKSSWILLFLSRACLNEEMLTLQLLEELKTSRSNVMVIIHDIPERDIPILLGCVRVINASEETYLLQIVQTLNGRALMKTLPLYVGRVAESLALEYFITYLEPLLSDFKTQLKRKMTEINIGSKLYTFCKKFLLIIPLDGQCVDDLTDLPDQDKAVKYAGRVDTIRYIRGFGRINLMSLFKILQRDSNELFFAGEYALPVRILQDMQQSTFIDYETDRLIEDINVFCEQLNFLLYHYSSIGDVCRILYVTDHTEAIRKITNAIEENSLPHQSDHSSDTD